MLKLLTGLWAWGTYREYKTQIIAFFVIAGFFYAIWSMVAYAFGIGYAYTIKVDVVSVEWHADDNNVKGGFRTATLRIANTTDDYFQHFYIECKNNKRLLPIRLNDYSGIAARETVTRSYRLDDTGIVELPSCWIANQMLGKPSKAVDENADDVITQSASAIEQSRLADIEVHINSLDKDIIDGKPTGLLSLFVVNNGSAASRFDIACTNPQGVVINLVDGSGVAVGEQSHHVYQVPDILKGPLTCSVVSFENGPANYDKTDWGNRVDYDLSFE